MAFSIYVADLAAYNNGKLHGEWFKLDDYSDADDLMTAVNERVISTSPEPDAEEWAIHDYSYDDCPSLGFGEYESFDTLIEANRLINEHGEALALWVSHTGNDWKNIYESDFQDAYCGCYRSELDYAEELFDEIYLNDLPESVRYYIDYEKFARDLFINDNFSEEGDEGTHVFRHV